MNIDSSVGLKYLSLVTLTVQNSLLTLLLHYSRNHALPYSAPAAVLLNEILKLSISLTIAIYNSSAQSPPDDGPSDKAPLVGSLHYICAVAHPDAHLSSPENLKSDLPIVPLLGRRPSLQNSSHSCRRRLKRLGPFFLKQSVQTFKLILSADCWKLSIPAILYVIQNNLQFVAASHLDVATFSVTYQLKILTTALCSVLILGRRLSNSKWLSLLCLAVGVALVQLQNAPSSTQQTESANRLLGFIAVMFACFTSGLAGVYFELVLKSTTKVDLWIRNVQLSLFSLLPALFTILFTTSSIHESLFANFGFWAWATVLTQVLGGLITALVIKFADNILKGFATSLSIILSTLASVILFNTPLPIGSAIGAAIVLLATYTYNLSPADAPPPALPIFTSPKAPVWGPPPLTVSVEPLGCPSASPRYSSQLPLSSPTTEQEFEMPMQTPSSPACSAQTCLTSPHPRVTTFFSGTDDSNSGR